MPDDEIDYRGNKNVYRDGDGRITYIGDDRVYRDNEGHITYIGDDRVTRDSDNRVTFVGDEWVTRGHDGQSIYWGDKDKKSSGNWDTDSYSDNGSSDRISNSSHTSTGQTVWVVIGFGVGLALCAIVAGQTMRGAPAQPTASPPTIQPASRFTNTSNPDQESLSKATPSSDFNASDIPEGMDGIVQVDSSLFLRTAPNRNSASRARLKNGTFLKILARNEDSSWFNVSVPSISKDGWVSATYVGLKIPVSQIPTLRYVPSPTETIQPINSPTFLPQNTPTPLVPDGVELNFLADQEFLQQGQCTIIRWGIGNVQAIYLNGEGLEGGYAEKQVCPSSTTTYTMKVVLRDGNTTERSVVVHVQ